MRVSLLSLSVLAGHAPERSSAVWVWPKPHGESSFLYGCRNVLTSNERLVSNSGTRSGRVGTTCTRQKIRVRGAPEPRRCAAGLRRAVRGAMQYGVSLGAAVRSHRHQSDLHQFHISHRGRVSRLRWRTRRGRCANSGRLPARVVTQSGNGVEQLHPVPDCCDPKLLEVLSRQARENRLVYVILPEAQAPQPDYNVHDGAPKIGGGRYHHRKGGRRKGQNTAPLSRISRLVSMRCSPRTLCTAAPARAKWLAAPRAAAYRGPTAADEQE
jgi:hypothetical protein